MMTYSKTLLATTHYSLKGSARWMAFELIDPDSEKDMHHTKASDMWAYGMVIYVSGSKRSLIKTAKSLYVGTDIGSVAI